MTQSPMLDLRQTVGNVGSATRRSRVSDIDPNTTMMSPITNRLLLSHCGTNGRTIAALKTMESPTAHGNNYSKNSRKAKHDYSHNNSGICFVYDSSDDSFRGDDRIALHSELLYVDNGSANNNNGNVNHGSVH
jgi:hypothetical protein